MAKKYVPSGYQIINITSTDVDDDGYLILESKDAKILYELLDNNNPKIVTKPILLNYEDILIGFAIISGSKLSLCQATYLNDGTLDSLNQVEFIFESDLVAVTFVNI